jgi:iron complex outermembrane receptor protein
VSSTSSRARTTAALQVDAYLARTGEGGAGKRAVSVAAGFGNIATDRFNVFGVLDFQKTDALRTSQRQFMTDLKHPRAAAAPAVGAPSRPTSVLRGSPARGYLQDQGFTINGQPITGTARINLSAPGCTPPHS